MEVYALTHPMHGVVYWDESLLDVAIHGTHIYKDCSLERASYEKSGLNWFVYPEGDMRRSDGTPCAGGCGYCNSHHMRCPHGIDHQYVADYYEKELWKIEKLKD